MIGLRVIVSLPVVVPCFPFILAGLLRRRNERTGGAHHRRGGQRQPSARAPFRPARHGSSPPAALPPCAPVRRAGLPCSALLPALGYCGAAAGLKAAFR